MDGLSLLAWIVGLTVLYGCWMLACAMHREPTEADERYSAIDRELDATDAFYTDLAKNVGI